MKANTRLFFLSAAVLAGLWLFFPSCDKDKKKDPPIEFRADFTASPNHGIMPFAAYFLDETTGEPLSWQWDFQFDSIPDDSIQNPAFTYAEPGFYSVELIAEDAVETDTMLKINYISVTSDAAQLTYDKAMPGDVNSEIIIPLRLGQQATLGAFTLRLIFDNYRLRVNAIESNDIPGIQSIINQDNGTVFMAWSSVNPAIIAEKGELLQIRAEILNILDSNARHTVIANPIEFADNNAQIIDNIEIILPKLWSPAK